MFVHMRKSVYYSKRQEKFKSKIVITQARYRLGGVLVGNFKIKTKLRTFKLPQITAKSDTLILHFRYLEYAKTPVSELWIPTSENAS